MNYLKASLGILLVLSSSRLIPHPPNFTTLLALTFYIPALLGLRYLPILIISFVITDFIIGFHHVILFTWGSVFFIGLVSQRFLKNRLYRIFGALFGAFLFYLITNFGVWSLGLYGYTFNGLILSYTLAIPFFMHSLISTFIFSAIIETVYKFYNLKVKNIN